jgi:hypothetical protein
VWLNQVGLKQELQVAIETKEKLEKELYSKFLCVLNEKKRKIVRAGAIRGSAL